MTVKGIIKLITKPHIFYKDLKKKIAKKRMDLKVGKNIIREGVSKNETQRNLEKQLTKKKRVEKKGVLKTVSEKKLEDKKELKNKKVSTKEVSLIKSIFAAVINKLPVANVTLEYYEVALYFSGGMGNIYQVEQWIEVLKELEKKKKILFIVRIKEVYEWIEKNTDFAVVYCKTIADLTKVYEDNNIKCVLYVNQGFKNFQSLITGSALHVHINHGESDKTSTITNQSKAYDYVFIVGDAAYDKYRLNLIKKDMSKFIKVGRPQLDYIEERKPFSIVNDDNESIKKKIVLYAPTWEGTHDSMNFTSLSDYGIPLVQQLINNPNYYVVYKPHPNTGSRDANVKKINNSIIKLINESSSGEVITEGDINSLYKHIDIAIFDNSAVAIDYLLFDKPMIMTDMFHRIKDRQSKPTIVKAARMLAPIDVYSISSIIDEEVSNDNLKDSRNKIKRYFLGDFDYSKKESTKKFISKILEIVKERDELVLRLKEENSYFNE